jgi:hypothetical protein
MPIERTGALSHSRIGIPQKRLGVTGQTVEVRRYLLRSVRFWVTIGTRNLQIGVPWILVFLFLVYRTSLVNSHIDESISYRAGAILAQMDEPVGSVVSIGSGPFPEHGVGWEAGSKATYFAGKRLIATDETVPSEKELPALVSDLAKAAADAVLVASPMTLDEDVY